EEGPKIILHGGKSLVKQHPPCNRAREQETVDHERREGPLFHVIDQKINCRKARKRGGNEARPQERIVNILEKIVGFEHARSKNNRNGKKEREPHGGGPLQAQQESATNSDAGA